MYCMHCIGLVLELLGGRAYQRGRLEHVQHDRACTEPRELGRPDGAAELGGRLVLGAARGLAGRS